MQVEKGTKYEGDTEKEQLTLSKGTHKSFLRGGGIAFGLERQAFVKWDWSRHSIYHLINKQGPLVLPEFVQIAGKRNKCQVVPSRSCGLEVWRQMSRIR